MDVCAASFSCTCIIIIHMVIIADMKQRCVMCAAGECYSHLNYADWVNILLIDVVDGYTSSVQMKK